MKQTKKTVALLVALCMILTAFSGVMMTASAAVPDYYAETFSDYGNALVDMDLLSGMGGEDNLRINNNVTREQAITMILSFMNESAKANALTDAEVTSALSKYPDQANISSWAKKFVAYATINGYVGGRTDGSYDPLGNVKGYEFSIMTLNGMGYKPGTDYAAMTALTAISGKYDFYLSGLEIQYLAKLDASVITRGDCMAILYGALNVKRADGVKQLAYLIGEGRLTQALADEKYLGPKTLDINDYTYDDFETDLGILTWYTDSDNEEDRTYGYGYIDIDTSNAHLGASSGKVYSEELSTGGTYLITANKGSFRSFKDTDVLGFYIYTNENSNIKKIQVVVQDEVDWGDSTILSSVSFESGKWVYNQSNPLGKKVSSDIIYRIKFKISPIDKTQPVEFWIDDMFISFDGFNPMTAVAADNSEPDSVANYTKRVFENAKTPVGATNLPAWDTSMETRNVTQETIDALNKVEFVEPKNIILMIGDGMGVNEVAASKVYGGAAWDDGSQYGTMAMELLPNHGFSMTDTIDGVTTDSAAGGTALSSGYKTSYTTVAMNRTRKRNLVTLAELAKSFGKKVGVATNVWVFDATPAVFAGHAATRYETDDIVLSEFMFAPELILGEDSGYQFDAIFSDAQYAQHIADNGMELCTTWDAALASTAASKYVTFRTPRIHTATDEGPNQAELFEYSLNTLSGSDEGFFLMFESGDIDGFGHNNDFDGNVAETREFDICVGMALKYVLENPDTVLIVTADHETGGLTLADGWETDKTKASWTTSGHSSANVPIYAIGYGTEIFNGATVQNNEISMFLGSLLANETFGGVEE